MLRFLVLVIVLLSLPINVISQSSPNTSGISDANVVDGSVHPELIPDQLAYRVLLTHIANVLANPKTTQAHANALLKASGITEGERDLFVGIIKDFGRRFNDMIAVQNHANDLAVAKGMPAQDFAQDQNALIVATQQRLREKLLADTVRALDAHVLREKAHMKVSKVAPMQMSH